MICCVWVRVKGTRSQNVLKNANMILKLLRHLKNFSFNFLQTKGSLIITMIIIIIHVSLYHLNYSQMNIALVDKVCLY